MALVAMLALLLSASGAIAPAITHHSDSLITGVFYAVLIGGAAAVPFFLTRSRNP